MDEQKVILHEDGTLEVFAEGLDVEAHAGPDCYVLTRDELEQHPIWIKKLEADEPNYAEQRKQAYEEAGATQERLTELLWEGFMEKRDNSKELKALQTKRDKIKKQFPKDN